MIFSFTFHFFPSFALVLILFPKHLGAGMQAECFNVMSYNNIHEVLLS